MKIQFKIVQEIKCYQILHAKIIALITLDAMMQKLERMKNAKNFTRDLL